MPQIIVTTDRRNERGEGTVMWRERINLSDFESDHFAAQLVERLGWAVGDAHEVERATVDGETIDDQAINGDASVRRPTAVQPA